MNGLFCDIGDLSIYNKLLVEIKNSGVDLNNLLKLWHGDTHLIADDKLRWKSNCPTFNIILEKIKNYFNVDIKASRFNLYKDSSHWKPYHHDAAAVKKDKMKTQNITIGVSFGMEREAGFEHVKSKTIISTPLPNGSVYIFNRDININWRHGILPVDPSIVIEKGRISIIVWGWVDIK